MSVVQSIDWAVLGPPVAVALLALLALLGDLVLPRQRNTITVAVSTAALPIVAIWIWAVQWGLERETLCVADSGCSYSVTPWTTSLQLLLLMGAVVVLLLSWPTLREQQLPPGEYCFLLLSSVSGGLVLAAAGDLVTLVVALEVVSLPVFALVGLRRGDARGAEAALKVFLVGIVSTAVMLFGIGLLYAARGTLFLDAAPRSPLPSDAAQPLTSAGLVLLLAGFAFKVSAVPFHAWAPDTYAGAPLPVAAYLSVVSKAAGFAGLLVVLAEGPYVDVVPAWTGVVGVVAAATMTLGNLVALRQRQAVRLLAWSSIAQAGYLLAPLAAVGMLPSGEAAGATLAYLLTYAAMNLAAFSVVVLVGRRRPRNLLIDYRGLAWSDPWPAAALAFALACLAGVPPGIIGLFAKVVVFRVLVDAGLGWLAVVMAINTVIALYYYLVWAAVLFARPEPAPATDEPAPARRAGVPVPIGLAAASTSAVAVLWSVLPQLVVGVRDLFG